MISVCILYFEIHCRDAVCFVRPRVQFAAVIELLQLYTVRDVFGTRMYRASRNQRAIILAIEYKIKREREGGEGKDIRTTFDCKRKVPVS